MDAPKRMRAPGGVRFAAWMLGINAFFVCLTGVLLLFVRFDKVATSAGQPMPGRGAFQIAGFVLLVIGLLEFLLIWALTDGSNVARIIATVLFGLGVLISLLQVLAGGSAGILAWIEMLFGVIILVCLWGTPAATDFFRRETGAWLSPKAPPPPPAPL